MMKPSMALAYNIMRRNRKAKGGMVMNEKLHPNQEPDMHQSSHQMMPEDEHSPDMIAALVHGIMAKKMSIGGGVEQVQDQEDPRVEDPDDYFAKGGEVDDDDDDEKDCYAQGGLVNEGGSVDENFLGDEQEEPLLEPELGNGATGRAALMEEDDDSDKRRKMMRGVMMRAMSR